MSKRALIKDILKICELCKTEFNVSNTSREMRRRFCSPYCAKSYNGKRNTGRIHTDATKQKMSEIRSGSKNAFYGKKHTEKTKQIIGQKNAKPFEEKYGTEIANLKKATLRKKFTGDGNPFFGKTHTLEAKSKMGRDVSGNKNPMFGKGDLLKGEKNGSWQGGISIGKYGEEFNETLKTEIRKRDNFVCEICRKNGYDVHHIDYNKHNNSKNNLITLCRSCHAKTNFEREKWQVLFENIICEKYGK
jgi:hypothetical protein